MATSTALRQAPRSTPQTFSHTWAFPLLLSVFFWLCPAAFGDLVLRGAVLKGAHMSVTAVIYREDDKIWLKRCLPSPHPGRQCRGATVTSLPVTQYRSQLADVTGLSKAQTKVGTAVGMPPVKLALIEQATYVKGLLMVIDQRRQALEPQIQQLERLLPLVQQQAAAYRDAGRELPERIQKLLDVGPGALQQIREGMREIDRFKGLIQLNHVISQSVASTWGFDDGATLPENVDTGVTGISSMSELIQKAFDPFVKNGTLEPLP